MMGYERVKLGEVASIRGGKRLPAGKDFTTTATPHPYIRARDIGGGKVEIHDAVFLDEGTAQTLRRYTVNKGDVCLTIVGANVGEMGVVPPFLDGANLTENAVKIVTNGKADQMFLKYALLGDDALGQMKVLAGGAAQPKLGIYKIETIEFPLPPLPVQRRIGAVLSAYDDLIENNQRRIRILEEMARTLYREWFVHFRFPGHEKFPRIVSTLGDIPQGWEVKKLGDILTVDKGVSYNGAGLTEVGNPMVNLKNIQPGGGFRRDATKPYSGDFKPRHTVQPGDVILANTDLTQAGNVVASPALIPRLGDGKPILISHHLFAVRPAQEISPLFFYHLLLTEDFRGFAKGFAIGTTVLGLPKEGILNFTFACPPLTLIRDFAARVSPMLKLIETLNERRDNLRQTRDLLLPRLLSGQVELKTEGT